MEERARSEEPTPSSAWGRRVPPAPGDSAILKPGKDHETAGHLKTRLLRMIIEHEKARKSASK